MLTTGHSGHRHTLGYIAERLGHHTHRKQYVAGSRTKAAVAMIMREVQDDLFDLDLIHADGRHLWCHVQSNGDIS